jgi:hypothetical protein
MITHAFDTLLPSKMSHLFQRIIYHPFPLALI